MSFFYDKFARPLLFRLDAETAHNFGIRALAAGLAGEKRFSDPVLRLERHK